MRSSRGTAPRRGAKTTTCCCWTACTSWARRSPLACASSTSRRLQPRGTIPNCNDCSTGWRAPVSKWRARRHGCRVIATVPRGGRPLDEVDLKGPVALLIGGEGQGLSPAVVDAGDERVSVPMEIPVESLNVAVTAALLVYEARRQRGGRS